MNGRTEREGAIYCSENQAEDQEEEATTTCKQRLLLIAVIAAVLSGLSGIFALEK